MNERILIGEMNMGKLKASVLYSVVLILISTITACSPRPRQMGTLQGQVTIGPLVPVVGPGMEEPTPGPEVFADRKVVIYDAKGKRELEQVDIQGGGSYRVDLEVGRYLVDINHLGIDHAKGLPATIEIHADEITILDIDIDTGIR
jgi:hypothetical protein